MKDQNDQHKPFTPLEPVISEEEIARQKAEFDALVALFPVDQCRKAIKTADEDDPGLGSNLKLYVKERLLDCEGRGEIELPPDFDETMDRKMDAVEIQKETETVVHSAIDHWISTLINVRCLDETGEAIRLNDKLSPVNPPSFYGLDLDKWEDLILAAIFANSMVLDEVAREMTEVFLKNVKKKIDKDGQLVVRQDDNLVIFRDDQGYYILPEQKEGEVD